MRLIVRSLAVLLATAAGPVALAAPKEITIEPTAPPAPSESTGKRGKSSRSTAPAAEVGNVRGLMWEAHSITGKGKAFLLGSIHVAAPSTYPLPPAMEKAFQGARTLVVEADVLRYDKAQIKQKFSVHGKFPPGAQSLRKALTPQCYETVKETAEGLGLPMHELIDMKPWLAALSLEMVEASMAGLNPDLGIDLHFLKEAHGSKRVVELEGVDDQIALFDALTKEQQNVLLCQTAKDSKNFDSEVKRMFQAWRSGDANGLAALIAETISQDREIKPVMDAIFTNRNVTMAARIQKLLEVDETYFIVVGAGHLVGPNGVVALLQQKQVSVEQR